MASENLYDVLGVRTDAPTPEIRHAYLRKARTLHPDKLAGADPAERATAERKMQDINAAWSVLGDEKKRNDYDRIGEPAGAPAGPPTVVWRAGSAPPDAHGNTDTDVGPGEEPPGPLTWLLRTAPAFIVVAVLLGIFVFTAFAVSDRSDQDGRNTDNGTDCLDISPNVVFVPCSGEHDAVVTTIVASGSTCPVDLQPIYRQGAAGLYCVTLVAPSRQ